MISYLYRPAGETKLSKLEAFQPKSLVLAEAPSADELKVLEQKFKLDPDLLADALDPDEIPRVDADNDLLYIYMRYSYRRGDVVDTDPVLIVVGRDFVGIVVRRQLPGLERLANSAMFVTTQRAKLLLLLLRHFVLTYEANINLLDRQIRGVRARLNVATVNNRDFVQFVVIEDALSTFLAELVPANLLLSSLLSGRYSVTFHEDDRDLIEDLVQETKQLEETSQSSLRTVVNIREAYSNIMTNNLNRRVGLLTSLTVVLTVPTIVFSAWGMNVPVPGTHDPAAFALIVLTTLVVIIGILYLLYRRRWL